METVTDSTLDALLITTVASAPVPSPLIGTRVYDWFAVPNPAPLFVIVTILSWPLVAALTHTGASIFGTGFSSVPVDLTLHVSVIFSLYVLLASGFDSSSNV